MKHSNFLLAYLILAGLSMAGLLMLSGCSTLDGPGATGPAGPGDSGAGLLFALNIGSGSILPHPNRQTNLFLLTLEDASAVINYFSDSPARMAGTMTTADFMRVFPDLPGGLPQIALELQDKSDPGKDVAIFEVANPKYGAAVNVISFDVKFLRAKEVRSLQYWRDRADLSFPKYFGPATLFVDGVPCRAALGAANCN